MSDRYGPNTAAVEALLERIRAVTVDELGKLGVTRRAAERATQDVAVRAARDAAQGPVWGFAEEAAEAAEVAVGDAAWIAQWDVAAGVTWDVVVDAAFALVVQDLISEEHFEALYGPWREVMG